MKTITIGKKKYKQMETLFDIYDERFNEFKKHLLQVFEKIDKPLWKNVFDKCKGYYNKNQHSDVIIELHNYDKAIELKETNYDAYSYCFALICLGEGESQKDIGHDIQMKKLTEMREAGLPRGIVEAAVENFMKASPRTFGAYLAVLEMMKPAVMAELLKE